jgi:methionine-rich copper-binding protein CopC
MSLLRMKAGVLVVSLLWASLLLVAFTTPAHASPELLWSDPAVDGFLTEMPTRVTIQFSHSLAPGATIVVVDETGSDITAGSTRIAGDQATVSLTPLLTGLYTVRWKAVSADDGSETSGSFQFFHLHLH